LFQTLFNCNASLICCFLYCLFWCCYFLVGFCKWFVTIFITSHGSIAIFLICFVLLLWMTHKCLTQLGVLPFSLNYFNLSLYKSQHSSSRLWYSICKFHTKDQSISTHWNFLQPLFCMSIVCQQLVGFKVQILVIGLNAHQPPSFLVSLGLNMMMKDGLKIKM